MRTCISLVLALAVAACTSTPPVQEPDDSPTQATAVIETLVTSNGLKGLFPFESTDKRYVRANMSRDEAAIKGTGTFSGFLFNAVGPNDDARIARLDRNLLWTLDLRKKQYTECPVRGCASASGSRQSAPEKPAQQQPEQKRDPGCTMHVAKKSFTVTPTGEKRAINGFDTDEYKVAWLVTLRDPAGRQSTSALKIDVWTTPVSQAMRDAMRIEQAYAQAYVGKLNLPDRSQVLPPEVSKMMLAYLGGGLSSSDRAALVAAGQELQKIKGHPISTRIDWDLSGNACASDSGSGSEAASQGSGSMLSGLSGLFGKKDGGAEPLLSFTIEIKSLKVTPVHDSMFTVPKDFRRTNP
jgi:hypothetical protein